jgi:alkylhydroperoxidase family enzyme
MAEVARRLAPTDPKNWSESTRALLGGTLEAVAELEGEPAGEDTRPVNILYTIAHHPTLLGPFLEFAAALAARGVLPRRDSELLALRAAWNCRSAFEWAHHVVFARAAGLGDDEIERIPAGAGAPGWGDSDRDLLEAADELHHGHDLSDDTWQRLRARWNDAQLVEIPFVVGQYTMLSMVANATGVAVEGELPPLPDAG